MQNFILADGRWRGAHGIGRFSHEVLSRLTLTDILSSGPSPLSLQNFIWQAHYLRKHKTQYKVFFNPGYNPPLFSAISYIFTIHDLIHLVTPGKSAYIKKMYYETLVKPATKKAFKILTVSEYSKKEIIEWCNLPEEKIVVVGNAVSAEFSPVGQKFNPGYPYFLHVGNTKFHKNVLRLIEAFAIAKIDPAIRLILTGHTTTELELCIKKFNLEHRIVFQPDLTDEQLAKYYRGAQAFILPSLYEGFGIPVIEAMSCGTPVIASHTTSLPEVAGDAALFIDPYRIESIAEAMEKISDDSLRKDLIAKGLEQCKLFSWDKTAEKVQLVLNEAF